MLSVDRSVTTKISGNREKSRRVFDLLKTFLLMTFYCDNYNGRCLLIILSDERFKGICYDNT